MDRIEEVSLAIDFIEANLTERLNLDRIADAVHYSKYHLHRVFSDTVGLTVHEYMKRRQLTESAKLLVFSEKPIVDIALLSGYRSQQAFTSAFTAMYKMPPNMYRENERFYPLQLRFDFERSYEMLDRKCRVENYICHRGRNSVLDGAGEVCDRRIPVPGRGGIYPGFEAENKDKTGADSKGQRACRRYPAVLL